MILYIHPHACSMAPHIALEESGLEFDIDVVDLQTKKAISGLDFLTVNPKGFVPALALDNDSGVVLTEVTTILTYLADQVPDKNLIPKKNELQRYEMMSLLSFISMDLHKNFSAFFYPEPIERWKEISLEKMSRSFTYLNKLLTNKDFLLNDSFSIADMYLFVMLHWCDYFSMSLDKWPEIKRYKANIQQLESVKKVLAIESNLAIQS
ncbi:glutathione S-transferase family protein [Acinetobacter sp. C32I]|uniref:glutathione S-transferase family protein n=1 Tax=Acinetobacter sp. C32I TaxID=2950074 RepID=UPI002036A236|nr:glutathione S-transferase family protein [Acinetobacter sp. C32I]USA54681.1 glutathione S-transferase family protein [Acinetobacter sp. C32I]